MSKSIKLSPANRALDRVVDKAQRLQAPAVHKYVNSVRRAHPDESPAQIIERLENRYLLAVTGSGGAVGATAAVPGVGTLASLAAMGGESAFFMEASALLTLAVADVHGISVHDSETRKALVLSVVLGDAGIAALRESFGGRNSSLKKVAGGNLPGPAMNGLNRRLTKMFIKRFAAKRAPLVVGKLLPAGIGAVVGSTGNRMLGKKIISNSRGAFGPPPLEFAAPAVVDGSVDDSGPQSLTQD